jgi:hypothetical protein
MTGISRRSVLRGGALAGLSTMAGPLAQPTVAAAAAHAPGHLVPDYRASHPTGWPWTPGQSFGDTLGGHITSRDFTYNRRACCVELFPVHPTYQDTPNAGAGGFRQVVDEACGDHYLLRYQGGFRGGKELKVHSYSAFTTQNGPETRFGADLHIVYEPDLRAGDPAADDCIQWIQVVHRVDPVGAAVELDNLARANPFYAFGGLTSVDGTAVVNFQDTPQTGVQSPVLPDGELPSLGDHTFLAETFLVRDTGHRTSAGKGIIDVYGGVTWGWRAHELPGPGR